MNLQLCSPYKICPFDCPFCMSNGIENIGFSDELWYNDKVSYLARLVGVIRKRNIETVVFTGSTEPTLFPQWMKECIEVIDSFFPNVKKELQTRNYNFTGEEYNFDVIAYSIYEKMENYPISSAPITRHVFIHNKNISIQDILNQHLINLKNGNQTTVKILVESTWNNLEINKWIEKNKRIPSMKAIKHMEELGIKYDPICTEAEGRYFIYRCNGKLYQFWDDKEPIRITKRSIEIN